MAATLKERTVAGLLWSFVESFTNIGVQFVAGIILARILSPREFGLIGMLTIFIALSQAFIDSGFTTALIRKKDCTQRDYSTIFYFNLGVSLCCFILLFVFAGAIASFFKEPELKPLVSVLGLGLIINAFSMIQRTILTKNINFKLQAKVSLIAALGSGLLAITMALQGFGVWSLVGLTLSRYALTSFFLWVFTRWKPMLVFCTESFTNLFSFGSKMLLSGLIDTAYRNIYLLVIGKYFSAQDLGFYTRADQFQSLPSSNLQGIISRVSYPVLSGMQDDLPRLKQAYVKIIRSTMLVTFLLMLGMAATARPMVLTLVGENWAPCIVYLQLLCFVGMFYPLHALNLNMLQVLGRSDLFLRLEIIKKTLAVPVILLAVFMGIKAMIIGMMFLTMVSFYLNSYWSGKMIGYSFFEQLKDILPSFLLAASINTCVFSLNLLAVNSSLLLMLQLTTGGMLTLVVCEIFRIQDYLYIKHIAVEKFIKYKTT